jgi:hypothetical protein
MTENFPHQRKPIAEVLTGMQIHPLEPGWTAIEALVAMKCLDQEGRITWAYRTTHPLTRAEFLGALIVQADVLRCELADEWLDDHDDGEP